MTKELKKGLTKECNENILLSVKNLIKNFLVNKIIIIIIEAAVYFEKEIYCNILNGKIY